MIVVHTNVLAYASIPGRSTASALAALRLDPDWVAPPLWRSELRNLLVLEMRLHAMSIDDALVAFGEAEKLVVDARLPADTAKVLALAGASGASAYDCEFVALAQELGIRLVTADRRLAGRFRSVAVELESFARAGG